MSIVIAGTGYVGLVTGACLCEVGHSVFCVDIDPERVRRLSAGEVPFYEPGLAALVKEGVASGRLTFTTSLRDAYQRSKEDRTLSAPVVMIAVGTPSADDGSADISIVLQVAKRDRPGHRRVHGGRIEVDGTGGHVRQGGTGDRRRGR